MRQNSDRVILPLDEHDWLKWSHDKFGTHDLLQRWPTVDHNRPVDRRVPVGRSLPKKRYLKRNTFQ